MKMKFVLLTALPLLLLLLLAQNAAAQQQRQKPSIRESDRVRLAEAFRVRDALGNRVWGDWRRTPFAVLLVTPATEFLIRHPKPSNDFERLGYDRLLKSDVYFRRRTQPVNFLAAFPLIGGVTTVVVGQAENTAAQHSTLWVVKVLHEHFHQLQDAQPGLFADVTALDLAGGDQTGMWQLNYPFPYSKPEVKARFEALSRLLAETLQTEDGKQFSEKFAAYLGARAAFEKSLAPADYRYLSFQLWKEGVARYTEYRVARLAAQKYAPSRRFRALEDYQAFEAVAGAIRKNILRSLSTLDFDRYRREAFYPFGAGEAMLLDRVSRKWQRRYFTDKFYLDKYFAIGRQ